MITINEYAHDYMCSAGLFGDGYSGGAYNNGTGYGFYHEGSGYGVGELGINGELEKYHDQI